MANVPSTGDRGIFDISAFKSHMSEYGNLPVNRFYVDLPLPRVLLNCSQLMNDFQAENININELLRFRAESVNAPGLSILLSDVNRYGIGPSQKLPYNVQFPIITINFLADKYSIVWGFFYNWLNNIFHYGHDANPEADGVRYRVGYMDDYAINSQINVYDYDGKPSTSIELIDFYPISMEDVALAWGTQNTAKHVTVKFAFRHWRMPYVEICDNYSSVTRPAILTIPRRQTTIVSATTKKPEAAVPTGRIQQSVPMGPQPEDPMQNRLNNQGLFNNPTIPGGTPQMTYMPGA